ncbi:MAG: UvrD-helicase domain-containing protein, partial [Actinobacteria bacterium]|nr:UvrD-helicase domain-containing protein [Actinomycetota bacterium]
MTSLFDHLPLPGPGSGSGGPRLHPQAGLPVGLAPTFDPQDGPAGDGRVASRVDAAGAAELLVGLNPEQREAVLHGGGPLLIVAGAGSGKTRVLTHRIAHLLATGRARPGEILAITFTNKAAAEMRERVASLVGPSAQRMWVSTFHSACVRILRKEASTLGLRSSFSIYDAADSQRLITLVSRELDLDPKRFPPKALAHKISNLKDELVDADDFARTSGEGRSNDFDTVLSQVYTRYTARLRQAQALDFDDLIMSTVGLLQAFPGVAEHYRRRFRHILVDEYQDTNHAQYVLVKELVGPAGGEPAPGELTVVGDADQSIYAFRGASIRNILEFEADYPSARTILLEQNYRSTQTILSAANAVIARNPGRRAKRLWTDSGAGAPIVAYVADTEQDEARFITAEIDRLGDAEGVRPGDVAIFYRANAQSRVLEDVLVRVGLPYKVVGGTRFYDRKEIKDALAYLR